MSASCSARSSILLIIYMLPNLPKKRKHKEAEITPLVIKWFMENWDNDCAIEIKVDDGKLKPHQAVALEQVRKGEFSYKLPDTGRRNPFDVVILKNADSALVRCTENVCTATISGRGKAIVSIQFRI